jgi:hypothetical protein
VYIADDCLFVNSCKFLSSQFEHLGAVFPYYLEIIKKLEIPCYLIPWMGISCYSIQGRETAFCFSYSWNIEDFRIKFDNFLVKLENFLMKLENFLMKFSLDDLSLLLDYNRYICPVIISYYCKWTFKCI